MYIHGTLCFKHSSKLFINTNWLMVEGGEIVMDPSPQTSLIWIYHIMQQSKTNILCKLKARWEGNSIRHRLCIFVG